MQAPAAAGTQWLQRFSVWLDMARAVCGLAAVLDDPGIEFRWGRFFVPLHTSPGTPTSLLYNGYRISFPGLKRPGRGVVRSFLSSAEVKETVEAYHHSSSGPQWPVIGRVLPILPLCILLCYTYTLYIILRIHNRKKLLCQNYETNKILLLCFRAS